MVVVNKRGGGGAAAMNYFKTRPADGNSILMFTVGHAITMAAGKTNLNLDEMAPLGRGTNDPQILMVNCKTTKYKTPEEFVAGVKAGDKLTYGGTQSGTIDHITVYLWAKAMGQSMPNYVPFGGGAELATQLVAGAVDVGTLNLSEASSQVEAGDVCPMVILDRNPMAPIPKAKTSIEMGIDLELATVRGYATHAGVDKARRDELEAGMMKAMNHSLYQAYLTNSGLDSTSPMGAEEWGKQMKMMVNEFGPALKEMGLVK
jgi:putative tricarboxylic transport membrane protein